MSEYPAAIDRPGPDWKRWSDANVHTGAILHSAEGYEHGLWSQLDGPAQAAWHFSVMQDGRVFQHYPIDQSPWHAGNKTGNVTLIGIEHEGRIGEPLTAVQLAASKALVAWLGQTCGWTPTRDPASRTLFEHNEIGTTTCPNGRIPWSEYEPAPIPPVPMPMFSFNYVGQGPETWMYDYELRLMTVQPAPNLTTVYMGKQGTDEVWRIRVEDWQ